MIGTNPTRKQKKKLRTKKTPSEEEMDVSVISQKEPVVKNETKKPPPLLKVGPTPLHGQRKIREGTHTAEHKGSTTEKPYPELERGDICFVPARALYGDHGKRKVWK